ncbi:tRNA pseudouridine(13) synthase TruD [Edwardsiella anguillarum]|uniref:tRNA pseudouridine(13) synthase TruD n=1 Tax=Edwardsiella anguillarum TaxID=1821960 RepID=UPI0024B80699|nr:tRNA pseudouridine(13) synthase TruD [Edwardsiella anguillarum]WHP79736.1 tRNA pseudouridine(13) synthase TruD [Edwardsiella anguillarum]WHQ17196.1 tRNA pseudouridine(13) synthase TruD [Edwardsiella anguillarum]WHQ20732.1 tRNA pseudouridine(13) synthase TruD [Edwardsiella anguillarum]WHQ24253.1 tRNA pseudouridine(13) synthase TruD [Edwardsiella anguillarum]WHQ27823.1 tRNA pseudouridine(13) synthase TruD [Edwardsiella anguillarum]
MEFSTLQYLHGRPAATGVVKAFAEDFFVAEDLGFAPDGEGEHVLVRLRKEGCNTQFVAENLARFARIAARSVSYAGLKDRHAVTEQWFCLHLPGRDTPDFSQFVLEGCQVMTVARHRKKLRIGTLRGNQFRLVLRHISDSAEVEERLRRVAAQGVPNYFGEQRFGRGGNNLQQARRWATDQIRVKERAKRGFYLSAARSALFNRLVSERLAAGCFSRALAGDALQLTGRGSWFVAQEAELAALQQRLDAGELRITAALPGDGDGGVAGDAAEFERRVLSEYADLQALLTRERVEPARRAVLLQPQVMAWNWWDDATVELTFDLPAGSFATSVVRELFCQENPDADLAE